MMRFPKSIRWRLQLWYGAMLIVLLCGFGAVTFHLEKGRQLRRADAELQTRVAAVIAALKATPGPGPEKREAPTLRFTPEQNALFGGASGHYYVIWMRGDKPIAVSSNAPANVTRPAKGDLFPRMRGEFRESFLFAPPVDCVLVGRSIANEQADFMTLAIILATVGAALLAAGLLGGWWFTTRAIRPVEDISRAAERIAAGDLTQRIDSTENESELGRLSSVLNSTFARLDAAFAQQARFTADAAHELRTPVAVILAQTQSTLARERPAAEYRETLEACERAAQRMRKLTDSLLTLARFDAGQEPLQRSDCDLSAIAAECVEHIRPLAGARGITIHCDFPSAPICADAGRVAQVITNLLGNAIEYNHDGGEIRIATKVDRLTIRNTGPGIPAEAVPHIFERFHRADSSRTSGHAGLGLAICKAIVTAHGGSIEAASEAGGETTFRVRFPAM